MAKKKALGRSPKVDVPATIAAVQRVWAVIAAIVAAKKIDTASIMALVSAVLELITALRAPGAVKPTPAQVSRAAKKAGLPAPKKGAASAWLAKQPTGVS